MPLNYTDIYLRSFSGGITDNYVEPREGKCAKADCFVINDDGDLELASGFEVIYNQEALAPIKHLGELNDEIYPVRNSTVYFYDNNALTVVPSPTGITAFDYSTADSYYCSAEWREHLLITSTGQSSPTQLERPVFVRKDENGNRKLLQAGLPQLTDGQLLLIASSTGGSVPAGTTNSYLYAFHWSYTYFVDDVQFKMVSNVQQTQIQTGGNIGPTATVTFTFTPLFPWLTAPSRSDLANIKLEIYRTKNNGDAFFKVGEVTNGFIGTFVDNKTDSDLNAFQNIYTDGGVLDFWPVPKCKYLTVVNDCAYYAWIEDELSGPTVIKRPYRVVQSILSNINGIDPDNYIETDDEITGISNVGGLPIVMTSTFIYRIEGIIDQFGNGFMKTKVISDKIGCVSNNGIVKTPVGLFWAGNFGFYFTDGYQYKKISDDLDRSYKRLVQNKSLAEKISGTYDPVNDRIYWSVCENSEEANLMWIYNLRTGGFTKRTGYQMITTSLLGRNDGIYRGDELGYIYRHADGLLSDYKRDPSVPSSQWERAHIPFDFLSACVDGGVPHIKKWMQEATISARSSTRVSYKPYSVNDDGNIIKDMKYVRDFDSFEWGDFNFAWGDPDFKWRRNEAITKQRHFPRGTMRCRRKQIGLKPVDVIQYKSDAFGTATLSYPNPSDTTIIAVSLDEAGRKWPIDIVGDKIAFSYNQYSELFEIKSRTDYVLLISGGVAILPNQRWQITGVTKKQFFELKTLSIKTSVIDNVGDEFKTKESGGNT